MLFWCTAVCARGHGDILLEESLCRVLSVKEYLGGVRPLAVCEYLFMKEYYRKTKSVRESKQRKERNWKHGA